MPRSEVSSQRPRSEAAAQQDPPAEPQDFSPPAVGAAGSRSARRLPLYRLRMPAESDPLEQVRWRERNYRHALAVADMAAAALALPLALGVIGGDRLRLLYLLLIPMIVLTSKVLGLYDHDELVVRKSTLDELPRLVNLASTFTLLVWATRHFSVVGSPATWDMVALWITLAASLSGGRLLARKYATFVSPIERCLVLGDARAYARLRGPFAHHRGVLLVGCFGLDRALTDSSALHRLASSEGVHRIIIAPDETLAPEYTLELVRRAKATGLRVSLLPGILEAVGSSVVCDDLGGVTLLGVPRFGLTRSSMAVKRGFDLVGTCVLLLVGAPIMAFAAALIRLDSKGPAFFRQTRVGRDGVHFEMIKLRTMVDEAEALKADLMALNETQGLFKIAEDPRITRVGRWLRRSNLDELPQLFNVLRGEMSLVGPRPLVLDEDIRISGLDRRRLHLKPGMTGPWQTLGSKRVPLAEMVKVDYLYVANWSLWNDVKILVRTIPQVVHARGR
jgi:exopolysaccharide biosynthesis polyprenyl glycosylphosphotransferase